MSTQVKLLRVLQEGEMMRVGSSESRRVDVRTIAATNVNLSMAKDAGRFREDLFYRLNVISIRLPPLRERADDIPLLAHHFLRKYADRSGKNIQGITNDALDAIQAHNWPGNVRELENVIEAAVVLSRGDTIRHIDLSPEFRKRTRVAPVLSGPGAAGNPMIDRSFSDAKGIAIQQFEHRYIHGMLARTGGNISEAARRSGLDRSNFRRVMLKYKGELDDVLPDR